MTHEWKPLGFRRTISFLLRRERAVASWHHFGLWLEIEKAESRRWPTSIYLWREHE